MKSGLTPSHAGDATSKLKKFIFLLIACCVSLFIYLDIFVYNVFVPHIAGLVETTFTPNLSPQPARSFDSPMTGISLSRYNITLASHNDIINSKRKQLQSKATTYSNATVPKNGGNTQNSRQQIDYYNSDSPEFNAALKKKGLERVDLHAFKSPYVITPHLYSDVGNTVIKPPGKRKVKVISVYNTPRWFKALYLVVYNRDFKKCPYNECVFDVLGYKKATADLLLFFPARLPRPPKRAPGQIWGYCSWESAQYYGYPSSTYPLWKNEFNIAVSYRVDAGLFMPNNYLAWRDSSTLLKYEDYVNIAKKKTKTAAWWVSHCKTHSKREEYVKEMQKYIDIDIYGKCGTKQCSKTHIEVCEQQLTDTYKFYLSFENSLCLDYVSEKFWRMFGYRTHVVPVGRSGFDYNKYVPGNFVVDAANFKTARDLAMYLKELGNDIPRYAQMLAEKDKLVSLNRKVDWCDVCERLHTQSDVMAKFKVKDIKTWSHSGKCRAVTDIR